MMVIRVEVKKVEHVVDSGAVHRHIGILRVGDRVREVVAAAIGDRLQTPIPLDELDDRDVVGVVVGNVAGLQYGDTTIIGMRVPSPKKSSGCT